MSTKSDAVQAMAATDEDIEALNEILHKAEREGRVTCLEFALRSPQPGAMSTGEVLARADAFYTWVSTGEVKVAAPTTNNGEG